MTNSVADAKVNVAVRFRPLIKREEESDASIQWFCDDHIIQQMNPTTGSLVQHSSPYTFDYIFGKEKTTEDVYRTVVSPIVQKSFQGFNGTVFCYGQTSSGKTHTLYGSDTDPGIITLTAQDLFNRIKNDPQRQYYIRVGLIEVYNERVTDLLNRDGDPIEIKEINGVVIPTGLQEIEILSADDMLNAAKQVQNERKIGETRMNKESSRSHTILRIIVDSVSNEHEDEGQVTNALLNFVDLAGSEKASQTGAVGERFKEATYINKSLSSLSQVVLQLSKMHNHPTTMNQNVSMNSTALMSTTRQPSKYINFRDSKLTRILQSSLNGKAFIAMICNVTPASVDETHSTLRFAKTAKKIKIEPTQNQGPVSGAEYKHKINELESLLMGKSTEVDRLRQQLAAIQKFQNLCTPAPACSIPDRRKTCCPSQLQGYRNEVIAEPRMLPPDFGSLLNRLPLRRASLAPYAEYITTNDQLSIKPSSSLELQESAVEMKSQLASFHPIKVDVQTETDFDDFVSPRCSISVPNESSVTSQTPTRALIHNYLLSTEYEQEWKEEKSFMQHEFEYKKEEARNYCAEINTLKAKLSEVETLCEQYKETCANNDELRQLCDQLKDESNREDEKLSEIATLREKLSEVEQLCEEYKETCANIDELQQLCDHMKEESSRKDEKVTALELQNAQILSEATLLKEEAQNYCAEINTLKEKLSEVETLREQYKETCANNDDLQQLCDHLKDESNKKDEKLSDVEKLCEEYKETCANIHELQQLCFHLKEESSRKDEKVAALELEKATILSDATFLKEKLNHFEKQKEDALNDCVEIDTLKEKLSEVEKLCGEYKENCANNNELQHLCDHLKEESTRKDEKVTALELAYANMVSDATLLQEKLNHFENEKEEAQNYCAEINSLKQKLSEVEKSCGEYKETCTNNDELRQLCDHMKEESSRKNEKVTALELQNAQILSEATLLKEEAQNYCAEINTLKEKLAQVEKSCGEYKETCANNDELQQLCDHLKEESTRKEEKLSEFETLCEQYKETCANNDDLQQLCDHLKEESSRREGKVTALELENANILSDATLLKEKLNHLENEKEESRTYCAEINMLKEKLSEVEELCQQHNETAANNNELQKLCDLLKEGASRKEEKLFEIEKLCEQYKQACANTDELQQLCDHLKEESSRKDEKLSEVEKLCEQYKDTCANNNELQQLCDHMKEESSRREEKVTALELENANILSDALLLKEQLNNFEKQKEETENYCAEISTLKKKLSEVEKLCQQHNEIRANNDELQKLCDHLKEESSRRAKKVTALELENAHILSNATLLKEQLNNFEKQKEETDNYCAEINTLKEKLSEVEKLCQQHNETRANTDELRKLYDLLKEEASRKEEKLFEIEKLCEQYKEACANTDELQQLCDHMKEESNRKDEKLSEVEKLCEQYKEICANNDELQQLCDHLKEESSRREEKVTVLELENANILSDALLLKEQLNNFEKQKEEAENYCAEINTLKKKLSEVEKLCQQHNEIRANNDELQKLCDHLKEESSRRAKKVTALELENANILRDATLLKEKLIHFEKQKEEAQNYCVEINTLKKKLSEVEKLCEQYKDICANNDDLQQLCVHLKEESNRKDEKLSEVEKLCEEYKEICANYNELQQLCDHLKEESSRMEEKVTALELENANMLSGTTLLKEKLNDFEKQKEEARNYCVEINTLKAKLLEVEKLCEQYEHSGNRKKPSLRSAAVQTSDSIDPMKYIQQLKIFARKKEQLLVMATKDFDKENTIAKRTIAELENKVSAITTEKESLKASLCYLAEEKKQCKEVKVVTDHCETGSQCDIIADLMERTKRGEPVTLPKGFPDYNKILKENFELKGKVAVFQSSNLMCTCKRSWSGTHTNVKRSTYARADLQNIPPVPTPPPVASIPPPPSSNEPPLKVKRDNRNVQPINFFDEPPLSSEEWTRQLESMLNDMPMSPKK